MDSQVLQECSPRSRHLGNLVKFTSFPVYLSMTPIIASMCFFATVSSLTLTTHSDPLPTSSPAVRAANLVLIKAQRFANAPVDVDSAVKVESVYHSSNNPAFVKERVGQYKDISAGLTWSPVLYAFISPETVAQTIETRRYLDGMNCNFLLSHLSPPETTTEMIAVVNAGGYDKDYLISKTSDVSPYYDTQLKTFMSAHLTLPARPPLKGSLAIPLICK